MKIRKLGSGYQAGKLWSRIIKRPPPTRSLSGLMCGLGWAHGFSVLHQVRVIGISLCRPDTMSTIFPTSFEFSRSNASRVFSVSGVVRYSKTGLAWLDWALSGTFNQLFMNISPPHHHSVNGCMPTRHVSSFDRSSLRSLTVTNTPSVTVIWNLRTCCLMINRTSRLLTSEWLLYR